MSDSLDAFRSTKTPAQPSSRGGRIMAAQNETRSDTVNPHGYAAFTPSFAREIFKVTQCGIIGNTYYTDAETQARETFKKLEEAAERNPLFLLKALVLARRSNIKMAPKLGVVALSRNATFCEEYEDSIVELLSTYHPKQLREYVEMQKGYDKKGLGYRQQRWVEKVMKGWNAEKLERYTLQYGDHVRVLLRLTHPDWNEPLLEYVFPKQEGTAKGIPFGAKQKAFTQVQDLMQHPTPQNIDRAGELILEHRIPFEAVKAIPCKDPRWWFALMMSCGTQGLLLNTRSFIEHGVFSYSQALHQYEQALSPTRVCEGRINPLDIIKTYTQIGDEQVKTVLAQALAASFNLPIPGIENDVIEVSVDSSGSMRGGVGNADQYAYLLANVFAYTFRGKARDVRFSWFFNNTLAFEGYEMEGKSSGWIAQRKTGRFPKWTGDTVTDMRMVLEYPYEAGYTNPSLIVERAIADRKRVDKFVVITDEAQNQGRPLAQVFTDYQKRVNDRAQLVVINQGTAPWSAVPNCENMVVYNTVTPAIFTAISGLGQDVGSVVEAVQL